MQELQPEESLQALWGKDGARPASERSAAFTEETWDGLCGIITSAFSLDQARASRLAANPVAKLIGAIPYIAGCVNAERSALSHLGTYIIAASQAGRAAFDHAERDNYDTLARLTTGAGFEGGDPAIIARGMKVLACVMIKGYVKDIESDRAAGLYNPVGAGAWDSEAKLAQLQAEIAAVSCPEMDRILPATKMGVFWEG